MAIRPRSIVGILVQVLALGFIAAAFCLRAPHVLGFSMEPRIHSGEFVLINTLAYRWASIRRGDIVAFRHDAPTPQTYLKRVIGLPGERIVIERGDVRVDGRLLDERYVHYRDRENRSGVLVPPSGLYVLGDNRLNSDDSRAWGILAERDVIGKAFVALPPLRGLSAP